MNLENEIVNAILDDLKDRRGFGNTWDAAGEEIQNEIISTWKSIIISILLPAETNFTGILKAKYIPKDIDTNIVLDQLDFQLFKMEDPLHNLEDLKLVTWLKSQGYTMPEIIIDKRP